MMLPLARREALRVEELSDELMVYDVDRHKAHCLSPIAAMVWRDCDGRKTVEEISAGLQRNGVKADEEMVWTVLHRLGKWDLLQERIALPEDAIRSSPKGPDAKDFRGGRNIGSADYDHICPNTCTCQKRKPRPPGRSGENEEHGEKESSGQKWRILAEGN